MRRHSLPAWRAAPPSFEDWWFSLSPSFLLGLTVQLLPRTNSSIVDASIESRFRSSRLLTGTQWTSHPNIYWTHSSLSNELPQLPSSPPRNGQPVPPSSVSPTPPSSWPIFSWLPQPRDTCLSFRKSFDGRRGSTLINCISTSLNRDSYHRLLGGILLYSDCSLYLTSYISL